MSEQEQKWRVKDQNKRQLESSECGALHFLVSCGLIFLRVLLKPGPRRKDRTKRGHLVVRDVSMRTTVKQQIRVT